MTLGLVIPVRDDYQRLLRLLKRARKLGCFDQIIIVDDGSAVPLDAVILSKTTKLAAETLDVLRHEQSRGAGAARNAGLERVNTEHVLFFDSDDEITNDLPVLWQDLKDTAFDFCQFRHNETATSAEGGWGVLPWDAELWARAGTWGALDTLSTDGANWLVQTANYPWNKIYRTSFLRQHNIGCAEVQVHEDITMHWRSFICAGTVLTSDRICATHYVDVAGRRESNRRGSERLEAFDLLEAIAAEIEATGLVRFGPPLVSFALHLAGWIRLNLIPEYHTALDRRVGAFLAPRRDWLYGETGFRMTPVALARAERWIAEADTVS